MNPINYLFIVISILIIITSWIFAFGKLILICVHFKSFYKDFVNKDDEDSYESYVIAGNGIIILILIFSLICALSIIGLPITIIIDCIYYFVYMYSYCNKYILKKNETV